MIDLHSHILPEVDDGAQDWAEALHMAKAAVRNGVAIIVATPHHQNGIYMNEAKKVFSAIHKFNTRLEEEGIPLKVYPSQETRMYSNFVKDLKEDKLLALNLASKYIYLELPFNEVPIYTEQLVFDIQLAGYIPIIPHPERNKKIRDNPLKIYQLVKKGALTQITSGSLLGNFGKEVQKFTKELIDYNLTHFIATDAHEPTGKRGYNLKEAYEALEEIGGEELVSRFKQNAERILEGKDLYIDIPEKIVKKKKFLGII